MIWNRPGRRAACVAALALMWGWAAGAPAAAASKVVVHTPEGDAVAPAPTQPVAKLATTAWLAAREQNGIVYFAFTSPARIERYDLAARAFLAPIALAGTPTAFAVDADGLYVGLGTALWTMGLDGSGLRFLHNTNNQIGEIAGLGAYVVASDYSWGWSFRKSDGATVDTTGDDTFWWPPRAMSPVPSLRRIYSRRWGSPGDILYTQLAADGTFVEQVDSPYHADYPDAVRVWVYPDLSRVADNAGIVYSTGDLTYAGSLAGSFDDLAFDGGDTIVLRWNQLVAYSPALLRKGQYTLASPAQAIAVHGGSVFAFRWGPGPSLYVEEVSTDALTMPSPGPAVDPHGLAYTPDEVLFDGSDVVYLLSIANKSIFRWSWTSGCYLPSIPLLKAPLHMALSTANQSLYVGYPGGEITAIPLATLVEAPLVNAAGSVGALVGAGPYLFAVGSIFAADGTLVDSGDGYYPGLYSREYTWSPANGRMYFFRDGISPNDILFQEILPNGTFGAAGESPYHGTFSIQPPIRVSPDGGLVLLGAGTLYNGTTLAFVDTLSNNIAEAVWAGGSLFTLRAFAGGTQIQKWGDPNYAVVGTRQLEGTPLRMFTAGSRLLVITLRDGVPEWSRWAFDLQGAGLAIRKTDSRVAVRFGDPLQYRIDVSNPSPSTITATVDDVLPPDLTGLGWSCTASAGSTCGAGASGDVHDTATVAAGGSLVYLVDAQATGPGPWVVNTAELLEAGGSRACASDRTGVDIAIYASGFENGMSGWLFWP